MRFRFDYYQLSVDYITINFQNCDLESFEMTRVIQYLDKLGFNSFRIFPKKYERESEPIQVNPFIQFFFIFD